jgi:hypothetical protein
MFREQTHVLSWSQSSQLGGASLLCTHHTTWIVTLGRVGLRTSFLLLGLGLSALGRCRSAQLMRLRLRSGNADTQPVCAQKV